MLLHLPGLLWFCTPGATCLAIAHTYIKVVFHIGLPRWLSGKKNLPANAGDAGSVSGWGRPLEEEEATHSSILAWRISWTEEPAGL